LGHPVIQGGWHDDPWLPWLMATAVTDVTDVMMSSGGPKFNMYWLVVWNIFYFSIQLGIILPTDFHIFQMG
jgi:hypothetical protein